MKYARAKDVVNFFCRIMDPDSDIVSLYTMQRLCYYAQGFSLAIFGRPLFPEKIYISRNGPYCKEVYEMFSKDNTASSIHSNQRNTFVTSENIGVLHPSFLFSQKEIDMLNEIWKVYGQFSGWKIRDLIWSDPCCEKYLHELRCEDKLESPIISHEDMKKYFKTLVKEVPHG